MTKDTDDGAPLLVIKEITALLGSEAVISFYFLSLLLKCFSNNSANAISNVIIISNSANVTYIHITSPHCFEGRKRNVSLPSDRGKQPPPFWCPPGANARTEDIIARFAKKVNIFALSEPIFSALFSFLSTNEVRYFIKTTMKGKEDIISWQKPK